MAKVIDLTNSDGDLVILGRSLVLPNSSTDSSPHPLNGALRFNPSIGSAQLFHDGAWITLGADTGGGGGTSNNHTHTVAQITGLQGLLNGKAPLIHSHSINDVTGLVGALSAKSAIGHGHSITDITGLRTELDSKSAIGHNHGIAIKDTISVCFPASPPANYKLVYTAGIALHFPINFTGSQVKVSTVPAASYTITLIKNITTVGSIIIYPSGQVTLNLPAVLDLTIGDILTFQCPARDTAINTISIALVGTRDSQTTA